MDALPTGGGMTGAAAGKGRPKRATTPEGNRDDEANENRRRPRSEREPTCLPTQSRAEERLTNSSSATEAGEGGRNHGKEPAASLCSLERVVRGRPRRKGVETGQTWLKRAKTTVVCDKPPKV